MKTSLQVVVKSTFLILTMLFMTAQVGMVVGASASAAASLNSNGRNNIGVLNSNKNTLVVPKLKPAAQAAAIAATHSATTEQKTVTNIPIAAQNNPVKQPETVAQSTASTKKQVKVAICHRTASVSNPYVYITVDSHAVDGIAGNSTGNQPDHFGEHTGPVFSQETAAAKNWGDIIPPVAGAHNGLNWNAAGQAIYDNGCTAITNTPSPDPTDQSQDKPTAQKVTLCHATGSTNNPFVRITVATAAAHNGHMNHQDQRDIIPPFDFNGNTYQLNWDEKGQAIYNNDCAEPAPTTNPVEETPGTILPASDEQGQILSAGAFTTNNDTQLAKTGTHAVIGLIAGLVMIAASVGLSFIGRPKISLQ